MISAADTTRLSGGPLWRYGGKGSIAQLLTPHLVRKKCYVETCFGAGGFFFAIPPGLYELEVVNDIDRAIVTFFSVLRDRQAELIEKCLLTPYAFDEFVACLKDVDDDLEMARRMWVRCRQAFSGRPVVNGSNPGWAKTGVALKAFASRRTESKLAELPTYADRLRKVEVHHCDAAKFVVDRMSPECMIYSDPPYAHESRSEGAEKVYGNEMSNFDHERMAFAHKQAAEAGAAVMVSGYNCALYEKLYRGWRRVDVDVALMGTRHDTGEEQRRIESIWMSYPASMEIGTNAIPLPKPRTAMERKLVAVAKRRMMGK